MESVILWAILEGGRGRAFDKSVSSPPGASISTAVPLIAKITPLGLNSAVAETEDYSDLGPTTAWRHKILPLGRRRRRSRFQLRTSSRRMPGIERMRRPPQALQSDRLESFCELLLSPPPG